MLACKRGSVSDKFERIPIEGLDLKVGLRGHWGDSQRLEKKFFSPADSHPLKQIMALGTVNCRRDGSRGMETLVGGGPLCTLPHSCEPSIIHNAPHLNILVPAIVFLYYSRDFPTHTAT